MAPRAARELGLAGPQQPRDFARLGEAVHAVLGEYFSAIQSHRENTVLAFDKLGFGLHRALDFGSHTGRLRQVVSHAAVFDLNAHGTTPSGGGV